MLKIACLHLEWFKDNEEQMACPLSWMVFPLGSDLRGPSQGCPHDLSPPHIMLTPWLHKGCFWSSLGAPTVDFGGQDPEICLGHLASALGLLCLFGRGRSVPHLLAEHPHAEQLGHDSTIHLPQKSSCL